MSAARLSVILPVLNEADALPATLEALQPLRTCGHEAVVVDGGSHDGTPALARRQADRVLVSERGRARQMNAGAAAARGDIFLFLHADTRLPADAARLVVQGLRCAGWGRFDVRLSGRHPALRVIERMMNWRSRLSGIATGDQAMFVRRDWFEAVAGFPDVPLMEDIGLSRRLKRLGPPLCLDARVIASSRRWEAGGIVRTVLLMWWLRLAYFVGADPARLARRYHHG